MIFGEIPLGDAQGAVLAHGQKLGSRRLRKGLRLSLQDIAALRDAGVTTVTAFRLDDDDVPEDVAAEKIASACADETVTASAAFTGRSNLYAARDGLVLFDQDRLNALNRIDESITIAALRPYASIHARQMVATIKIIPFAVPQARLQTCLEQLGGEPLFKIAPYAGIRASLIETTLGEPSAKASAKLKKVTQERLTALHGTLDDHIQVGHRQGEIGEAVGKLGAMGCELILIAGATATTDRRDVVPTGIMEAGGEIDHFGMPVDPGNLLLVAHIKDTPVIGLPGCARSPKLNGFDWVLERVAAGLRVDSNDVMSMGSGGLLKEIGTRPLPRSQATEEPRPPTSAAPNIAAVIMAAGTSSRMGGRNKLLETIGGTSMLRLTVESVLASQAHPVVVVTGRDAEDVKEALSGLDVALAHNADFEEGMSSSLRVGLEALDEDIDGALICLGDMPFVECSDMDKLIAAFDEDEGRTICLPVYQGKWGNPVLWSHQYFREMAAVSGDKGARELLHTYAERICEVPAKNDGVMRDFDTPEAIKAISTGDKP